jgi:hypothetical protein
MIGTACAKYFRGCSILLLLAFHLGEFLLIDTSAFISRDRPSILGRLEKAGVTKILPLSRRARARTLSFYPDQLMMPRGNIHQDSIECGSLDWF